jgi:catechol 2,3-dioxygenase-like lactoylglutathione lyase family enzyme
VPLFDHIGITVDDLPRSIAQFDPVMQALGCTRQDADNGVSWYLGEEELILFAAREPGTGPHRHGRVGWQHLALPVDSRADVDRLHEIAVGAGGRQSADPSCSRASTTATTPPSSGRQRHPHRVHVQHAPGISRRLNLAVPRAPLQ